MKKYLLIMVVALTMLAGACTKEGTGSPVNDEASARVAFLKVKEMWVKQIRPGLAVGNQTFVNKTLTDSAGGSAVINGTYSSNRSSSSSSSLTQYSTDVFITFQQYKYGDLTLVGTLRFFDNYSSRTACSSYSCATSTHSSQAYNSEKSAGVASEPISLQFSNNGKMYKDMLLFKAGQSDTQTWRVTITNGNKNEFFFNY